MNLLGKIWTVVYALLAALAAILSLPVIAFLIALGFVRFNDAVGWFELGEWHAWLGIIFAMYALYAGIVVGPLVWWRICAKRFDLPHKVNTVVTIGLVVFFGIICAWIVHGEQPTTNQIRLEAVSDDGNLVIVQKILRGSSILYVIDISSGQVNRLTANADGFEGAAGFSPDGKRVVFATAKTKRTSGSCLPTTVSETNVRSFRKLETTLGRAFHVTVKPSISLAILCPIRPTWTSTLRPSMAGE